MPLKPIVNPARTYASYNNAMKKITDLLESPWGKAMIAEHGEPCYLICANEQGRFFGVIRGEQWIPAALGDNGVCVIL